MFSGSFILQIVRDPETSDGKHLRLFDTAAQWDVSIIHIVRFIM